jgi:DNA-directed RNA polymerase II subunit RPB11
MALLRHKDVTFAGYRLVHPLQHLVELKLQTNGKIEPHEVFRQTVQTLASEMNHLAEEWIRKVQLREQDQMKEEI